MTIDEASRAMIHLTDEKRLIAILISGDAPRLLEALRLRATDIDFERGEVTVPERKGDSDRITTIPRPIITQLQAHLVRAKLVHQQDVNDGYGRA